MPTGEPAVHSERGQDDRTPGHPRGVPRLKRTGHGVRAGQLRLPVGEEDMHRAGEPSPGTGEVHDLEGGAPDRRADEPSRSTTVAGGASSSSTCDTKRSSSLRDAYSACVMPVPVCCTSTSPASTTSSPPSAPSWRSAPASTQLTIATPAWACRAKPAPGATRCSSHADHRPERDVAGVVVRAGREAVPGA